MKVFYVLVEFPGKARVDACLSSWAPRPHTLLLGPDCLNIHKAFKFIGYLTVLIQAPDFMLFHFVIFSHFPYSRCASWIHQSEQKAVCCPEIACTPYSPLPFSLINFNSILQVSQVLPDPHFRQADLPLGQLQLCKSVKSVSLINVLIS